MLTSLIASCPTITRQSLTVGLLGVLLSIPAWGFFLRGVWGLVSFIRAGRPEHYPRLNNVGERLGTLLKEVVLHSQMARKPGVALAHWFVMVGFLIGSLVWFEAYIQTFNPAGSWPFFGTTTAYHLMDEILGVGTVVGIIALMIARQVVMRRPARRSGDSSGNRFWGSNAPAAYFVELVVLVEGLGMILVKAGRMATYPLLFPREWTDPVSGAIASLLPQSALMVSLFALVKLLTGMVWLFIVGQQLRWGVAWHRFLAFFTIFTQRNSDGAAAVGALPTPDLAAASAAPATQDASGPDAAPAAVGIGTLADASWKLLLDASTCTECGRCQEQCPAWNTNKPLSPKLLMMDLRDAAVAAHQGSSLPAGSHAAEYAYAADGGGMAPDSVITPDLKLVGNAIDPDVLWSCTNCGACVEQCPVDIEHLDHVAGLRRFQVLEEAAFPGELTGLFKNVEAKGNPWGGARSERLTWVEEARRDGLEVPLAQESDGDFEYLFWVGCAGTYDDAARATTRAVVELLHTAGVKFAVLGDGETCTGDPVRRAGNEFLFQMLAEENVSTLNATFEGFPAGQRKIITTCAHCFNTLRNEYPDFDGHYDVFHHSQLLNRLVKEGLLKPIPRTPDKRKPITYHDPCFLGRHNKVFDPPRELLEATGVTVAEMPRNKNEGFCCGAGGARMFMEETLGTRIADARAQEAAATGAAEVAVGCPFCNSMLTAGMKGAAIQDAPRVRDMAQLIRDAVADDEGRLPAANAKKYLEQPVRNIPEEHLGLPTSTGSFPAVTGSFPAVAAEDAPTPQAPAPKAAPPRPAAPKAPGAAKPAAPKAPGGAKPKPAAPKAPGAATPKPAAPKAPGAATPKPAAPKAPGAATPKPAAPKAPGGAKPKPGAPKPPGAAKPKP